MYEHDFAFSHEPKIEASLEVAYTIERHLKMYAKSENTTERHQVLWHAWSQNKRWLAQLLEWTLPSFQTYSYHNVSHADSVLHNIERILGEARIRQLSASDCFMLLHVTYMHDIGMCISASERAEMMKDDKFIDLIERLEKEGDVDMRKAAESVLRTMYTTYSETSARERPKNMKKLFQEKLDVYYGLSQLMAAYQRERHAGKVKERMHQLALDPEKLGNGFSVSGIPLRIFLRIADCAAIHTMSGIEPVLELPKEDSGYVLDMIHPRFVAVMLQLGDALDLDNDRFNPFAFQFAGSFPRTSTLHFKKHQAIRQLNITPKVIQINADCDSQEVLRMVRMECESIEEILKNASYYWAEIAPGRLSGCLPTLDQSRILLNGQQVPAELVKAQFNISQVRAFRLLEGANVYGGNFIFLREIIQNAIDASKLQCWEDYIYRCKLKERKILQDSYEAVEYGLNASEKEILSEIDVWDYPIELYFDIGIQIRDDKEEVIFISIEEATEEQQAKGEYGVRFTVRDHGTGISKDDLIKISNVGSSYEEKKHFIDKMPDWLKPTGQFGIGLQSVFLISDSVTARTYTRSGEKYEITFNKVSNGSGGYINVMPLPQDTYVTFGTTFEIFLHNKYKRPHAEFWKAWNTESEEADRFISDYDKKRPLRHSQEMLTQMIMYIDNMLGENLFPIYAQIRGKKFEKRQYDFIKKSVTKIGLSAVAVEDTDLEKEKYISWLFKAIQPEKEKNSEDGSNLIIVDIKDGIGALDCEKAKLYIWNNTLGVFARFGCSRMLSTYSRVSNLQEVETQDKRKTRVYLKGIYVQSHSMYQDSELLELIDIKGGKIGKAHIAINRNEFTKEGIEYLENVIYPEMIASAKEALVELNEQANLEEEKWKKENKKDSYKPFDVRIMESIFKKTEACIEAGENLTVLKLDLEETVLSAIGLSYFLRVLGKEKRLLCEKRGQKEEVCRWDQLLNSIVEFRWYGKLPSEGDKIREVDDDQRKKFDEYINCGMLHKMKVYYFAELKRTGTDSEKEVLDYASLLSEKRKIAIISVRHNEYSKWFYIPVIIYEQEKLNARGKYEQNEKKLSFKKGENAYEMFEARPRTLEEETENLLKMEVWADGVFSHFEDIATIQKLHEEYGVDSDIQYTLNYMLSNIPTVALYANRDGNIRINVLSAEKTKSVFFNKNMKLLILKKVQTLYTKSHAKRFVTTVWRSYECISLQKIPSSVCRVNGAYVARQQENQMLLPVLGENIGKLLHLKEQDFFKDFKEQKEHCEELEETCENYLNFYQKFKDVISGEIDSGDEVELEIKEYLELEKIFEEGNRIEYAEENILTQSYWLELNRLIKKEIQLSLKKRKENKDISFDVLKQSKPGINSFQRMVIERFFDARNTKLQPTKMLEQEDKEKWWEWFIDAICFVEKYRKLDLREWITTHPKMEEFKRLLWGKERGKNDDTVKKNMIEYVMKNTKENLTEKQISSCYEKLFDDMIECVIENETEKTEKKCTNFEALLELA